MYRQVHCVVILCLNRFLVKARSRREYPLGYLGFHQLHFKVFPLGKKCCNDDIHRGLLLIEIGYLACIPDQTTTHFKTLERLKEEQKREPLH